MGQRTKYVDPSTGNPWDQGPIHTDALTVAVAWSKSTRRIACAFAVAVSAHETNRKTNQQDDDTRMQDDGTTAVIHRTGGVFQLDIPSLSPFQKGDAIAAFGPIVGPTKNIYDLQDSCDIFAALSEKRLDWLQSHFPDMTDDVARFWLAVGHNLGTGTMQKSATKHNGDAEEFLNDPGNASLGIVAHGYGRDAMTGGPDYNRNMEPDVTDPTGADAPTLSASAKSNLSWLLILAILVVVYWFAWGRHDRKVTRWLASI